MAKILIADDEPAIVMVVRDELAFEGFDVHTAATGVEAVETARATRPDVLLRPYDAGHEWVRGLQTTPSRTA